MTGLERLARSWAAPARVTLWMLVLSRGLCVVMT